MVANSRGDLYYKVMAMAMEEIGEGDDELWWWISNGEWWIKSGGGDSVLRRLVSRMASFPPQKLLGLT